MTISYLKPTLSEWTSGVGDEQGGPVCCDSWGHEESDTTERLNWTELNWNSSCAISNPKRWCCESAALNMPANLENSAVATGLEKSVFISTPKKGNAKECSNYRIIALISHTSKVMLNILQAKPAIREQWTCRCSSWFLKRQTNQRSLCQYPLDHRKRKRVPEKHLFLLYWLCQSLWLCGSQ